ncbi:MAG: YraN family protein [Treponema sp.]|nr:YraN family protein [Treponema sp.]
MNLNNNSTRAKGAVAEEKACRYLCECGYEIICRNWRTKTGEIDIIAQKNSVLVFAEVKANPNGDLESLMRRLDRRKQKKIVETTKLFLSNHREYSNRVVRFDVLIVDMPSLPSVYHIENAFSELV